MQDEPLTSSDEQFRDVIYRDMSQELAGQLLENPDEGELEGSRQRLSVLFSDIPNYTSLIENLEPEEIVEMLNQYFEQMVGVIFEHNGTLDKYIGTAIMAVFGFPLPLDNHEWMIICTALEMRRLLIECNAERATRNYTSIQMNIGIHSDEMIRDKIGSSQRMEWTTVGSGVHLAEQLQRATQKYGTDIIIGDNTYAVCQERIWARELDYIKVKGYKRPVRIYELLGFRSEPLSDTKQTMIAHYHKGREYYANQNFPRAIIEFGHALEIKPDDKPSHLHLARRQQMLCDPPLVDWDGSWIHDAA